MVLLVRDMTKEQDAKVLRKWQDKQSSASRRLYVLILPENAISTDNHLSPGAREVEYVVVMR